MNVHDLPATPARLRHVAGRLGLGERAYTRAREIAGFAPDSGEWRRLIDRFLLVFGTALIVAGVTAFFAYNWAGLHRFWKFGLIEAGIAASVGLAWWRGLDGGVGRSALFAAAFLVGVLLGVYTQAYQAGADPYGLFVAWGMLILGWVVIGGQAGLWMLLLVLVNLSLILPEVAEEFTFYPRPWISTLLFGALLFYVQRDIWTSMFGDPAGSAARAAYGVTAVVIIAALPAPGLILALLVMSLGLVHGNPLYAGAGVVYLASTPPCSPSPSPWWGRARRSSSPAGC
jgi:uncharacterized membrane protein